jgi:YidC/Oxa1 family membrane protein insertase
VRPIGLVSRAAKSPDLDSWTNHVGPIGVFDGKADYDVDWKTLDEAGPSPACSFDSRGGWLGFTDKYWLTALAPAATRRSRQLPPSAERRPTRPIMRAPRRRAPGQARHRPKPACSPAPRKRPGSTATRTPASQALQVDRLGLVRMVHAADLRPADVAVPPLGNFGVAIICLTLIVRG